MLFKEAVYHITSRTKPAYDVPHAKTLLYCKPMATIPWQKRDGHILILNLSSAKKGHSKLVTLIAIIKAVFT